MARTLLRIVLAVVVVAVAAVVFLTLLARPARSCDVCRADRSRDGSQPLVIAHQGGDGLWPGDTMFAFQRAVDLGVDMLEMDMHATSDGHLVMMHDAAVDRTTDGSGQIKDMTLAELKALDAGYDWSPDGGQTFPYRGQGITAATLDEVFTAFPGVPMNIEIKQVEPSIAGSFCEAIRQYGMVDKVLVASFRAQALEEFRQACPEVSTSTSEEEVRNFFFRHLAFLGGTYTPQAQAVQVPEYSAGFHVLTPRFVRDAHNRNLAVHAWTINQVDEMERMVELGLDGIITDYPDRLLEVLGR